MKFYYDLMSQPSRAIFIYLKKNKINFTDCPVALRKGEHLTSDYAKINPFKRVPAIDDDGLKLSESVAISRYLTLKYDGQVSDFWLPKDPVKQARINEYMDWQQWNTRNNCAMYFQHKLIIPMLTQKPVNKEKLAAYQKLMEDTLDKFENIWLKDREYISTDHLTLADLFAICELQQPGLVGYNIFENRPKLTAWYKKTKDQLQPEFDEASAITEILKEAYAKGAIKIPS